MLRAFSGLWMMGGAELDDRWPLQWKEKCDCLCVRHYRPALPGPAFLH